MRGYNHFETLERRVRVFDNALRAMDRFDPDQILIACNTLSVIYSHTPFARETNKKVREIVSHGVEMLLSTWPGILPAWPWCSAPPRRLRQHPMKRG